MKYKARLFYVGMRGPIMINIVSHRLGFLHHEIADKYTEAVQRVSLRLWYTETSTKWIAGSSVPVLVSKYMYDENYCKQDLMKLVCSLYKFKDAVQMWHGVITESFQKAAISGAQIAPRFFTIVAIVIIYYVDDIVMFSRENHAVHMVKQRLQNDFTLKG